MYDQVLNIYFAQARMYDPGLRRFLAVDPIRGTIFNPQLMVQYTYVINNPLRWVDPLGLSPQYVCWLDLLSSGGQKSYHDYKDLIVLTKGGQTIYLDPYTDFDFRDGTPHVDISGLFPQDNDWMNDLCDFELGFLAGVIGGSGNALQALQALTDARELHAQGKSIQSIAQGELFDFASEFATNLIDLRNLLSMPHIPTSPFTFVSHSEEIMPVVGAMVLAERAIPVVERIIIWVGAVITGILIGEAVSDALGVSEWDAPTQTQQRPSTSGETGVQLGGGAMVGGNVGQGGLTDAQIEDELEREAGRHGVGQCAAAAAAMAAILRRNGRRYEQISITFAARTNVVSVSRVLPNLPNQIIATNGFHVGILFNGRVRCNIHPAGLPLSAWLNDFLSIQRGDEGTVTPASYQTLKTRHTIYDLPPSMFGPPS